ncbi:type VI lipase adapter Tla3 domain-containing protein [Burkholderia alba]|uniref:type VI lipase adapter Tla3 domain-containing protein n=1 Tax=Burkholderia alba TaxID=2683677 RepID=UPI002B052BB2|nr:DUF2875 family protein [Burkholderia alba]
MSSNIRNGVFILFGIAIVAYGASFAWLHRSQTSGSVSTRDGTQGVVLTEPDVAHGILAQTGQRFALEVRGLSIVVGTNSSDEIWRAIESKASNFETYRSQDPKDHAKSSDERMTRLGVAETVAFETGVKRAVERWPIPVFIWGPLKAAHSGRAAVDISDARQEAGLGATLFLWQEDSNTDDPIVMIEKLFEFFDTHPDVPQAILFSEDGSMLRSLLQTPGEKPLPRWEYVPAIPDSYEVMVVSRSDRVDKLIRPFAVDGVSGDASDDGKLWDYYWEKNDGQGPDGFAAYYRSHTKNEGVGPTWVPGTMQASWWQQQLPAFWKGISNKGPGQFTPTPYLPIRWTEGQLKQFDNAPLIGYLHRPVDVKLSNDQGQPLKTSEQAEALKAGWTQALRTLPEGVVPKRVFYDTSGDRQWAIPLTQALAGAGKTAPDLGDVHEGYDIGRRIADTGVSSAMVQMGLGLIAGYTDGATSATVSRRPDGRATIIMVSPPSPERKAEWEKANGNANPFD